jgi:hypothetical protein
MQSETAKPRRAKLQTTTPNIHLPVLISQAAVCVWLFVRLAALSDPAWPSLTDVPEAPVGVGLK